ncbi:hypothetical protein B9Z55_022803 [Caenorhabditis nigoni]|uniref:SLED domain-containing protein n=1 Tax=Caenorhabditis nigoni TaxID=1611254 RepID=A0A2G5SME8_9PELO|nr:hypothetical protein B9Z55_022803 [Caenorhabditis nigoni]
MSQFLEMRLPEGMTPFLGSHTWEDDLNKFEQGAARFVPITKLAHGFGDREIFKFLKDGVIFETPVPEFQSLEEGVEFRWYAKILDVCGYRVRARFLGSDNTFWIHFFSEDVHYFGEGKLRDDVRYKPPPGWAFNKRVLKRYLDKKTRKNMILPKLHEERKRAQHPSNFVGRRVELLGCDDTTKLRVATIRRQCNSRFQVSVSPEDYPQAIEEGCPFLRQTTENFWIDFCSPYIYPVTFSHFARYGTDFPENYKIHVREVVHSWLEPGEPAYDPLDYKLEDSVILAVGYCGDVSNLKVNMKFELLDPFSGKFKSLHVASVVRVLTTPPQLVVTIDGPNSAAESFPLRPNSHYLFPIGYAEEYGLPLETPYPHFQWGEYLKNEKAEPLPVWHFRQNPCFDKERLAWFEPGRFLEAASQVDNHFIGPAKIRSRHGRIVRIGFEGWGENHDELYDIDLQNGITQNSLNHENCKMGMFRYSEYLKIGINPDLLPIGWCELHGYDLRSPVVEIDD